MTHLIMNRMALDMVSLSTSQTPIGLISGHLLIAISMQANKGARPSGSGQIDGFSSRPVKGRVWLVCAPQMNDGRKENSYM